jgi:predicted small lipoprotein YifL
MRTLPFKLCINIVLLTALAGCYPKGPIYYSDSDLVATNYDNGFNFDEQNTYALPDSVIHVVDPDERDPEIDRTYDQTILDRLESNMDARGYVKVDDPFDADFILQPYVWSATSTGVIYDYGYWGWYYPYGGFYPYYPWGGYVYSYTYGTVLVDIIDKNGIDIQEEFIPVVWTGALNGALSDNISDVRNRIRDGIDQCFEQSPYLTATE